MAEAYAKGAAIEIEIRRRRRIDRKIDNIPATRMAVITTRFAPISK